MPVLFFVFVLVVARVRDEFSVKKMVRRYVELCNQLLDHGVDMSVPDSVDT